MLAVIYSDEFLKHQTGRFHPERPQRLEAIREAILAAPWSDSVHWLSPTSLEERDALVYVTRLHDADYVAEVRALASKGGGALDPDTPVSPQSHEVALLAVNAWLDGVERVSSTGKPAFVLARPPGHHAERHTGMGFCLFSNAAIAAHYAIERLGVGRVAILDWDVHHGNGTQSLVENHRQIAYCSLHQSPCYPGTGRASDRGAYNNVLNLPMLAGSTGNDYRAAMETEVVPFLRNFAPELLIVSAGYDGNRADPLASIALEPEDFGDFTRACLQITSRILFGLEGGYDLDALSQSVLATMASCLDI